jgi:hypothetical protein
VDADVVAPDDEDIGLVCWATTGVAWLASSNVTTPASTRIVFRPEFMSTPPSR